MKRKFLSVVMAACAALFSFSGLTGCSGGGQTEGKYTATLEQLAKGIRIIEVDSGSGTSFTVGVEGDGLFEDDYTVAYATALLSFSDQKVKVKFEADQTSFKPGQEGVPVGQRVLDKVKMVFYWLDPSMAEDSDVVKAFSGIDYGNALKTAPVAELQFVAGTMGGTCTVKTDVSYTKGDGSPATESAELPGSFTIN